MPYKKRYPARRNKPSTKYARKVPSQDVVKVRTPYGFSDMTVAEAASRAMSIASSLAGIINSELLHYDESNNNTPNSSTGSVFSLVRGMAQGDTNNTFTGNSILLKKINLKGTVTINASATTSRVRFMVLVDKRPQSAVPAVTDILSSANVTSFMNIDDQLLRFKVLKSRTFAIDANTLREIPFAYNFDMNRHIKFDDTQTPVSGDLVVLLLSDEATNTPTVNMQSRIRYYDN